MLRKKKCVITYKLGIQGDITCSSYYDYTLNISGAVFGLNIILYLIKETIEYIVNVVNVDWFKNL